MTGRFSVNEVTSSVRWPDSLLEKVTVDYETVRVQVRESTGTTKVVLASGYVGYALVGFWDEGVIEKVEILDDHPSIARCVESITKRLGANWSDTGSPDRNTRRWRAMLVYLSDGAVLEIVAASFAIEKR